MLLIILLVLPQKIKKKDTDTGPNSLSCSHTSRFSNKMMTSHIPSSGLVFPLALIYFSSSRQEVEKKQSLK